MRGESPGLVDSMGTVVHGKDASTRQAGITFHILRTLRRGACPVSCRCLPATPMPFLGSGQPTVSGTMSFLWAVPHQAPWAKTQSPNACQLLTLLHLAPEGFPGFPVQGEVFHHLSVPSFWVWVETNHTLSEMCGSPKAKWFQERTLCLGWPYPEMYSFQDQRGTLPGGVVIDTTPPGVNYQWEIAFF